MSTKLSMVVSIEECSNGGVIYITCSNAEHIKVVAEQSAYSCADRIRQILSEAVLRGYDSWKADQAKKHQEFPVVEEELLSKDAA